VPDGYIKAGICLSNGGNYIAMRRYHRWIILILIILAVAIWIDLPNNPGIHVFGIERDITTSLGLDLVGGVQALLEADLPADTPIDAEAMQTARTIVENRVNGLGVTEAVVQLAGDRRIVVELPGETDPERALATLKQTGLLEFVDLSSLSPDQAFALVGTTIETDFARSEESQQEEGVEPSQIYPTVITGSALGNVGVTTGPTGDYQVAFELKSEEAKIFSDYTTKNVGTVLAIVLDKQIISAPRINEPITDGQGVISGDFTLEGANELAVQLRYGSLPIPLTVVETRTVGPTLGSDSLQKSLVAGLIGFTVVILFMILYYRLPGIVADIAIIIYAILAFAIFRFIPITLSLAGIAGFLLSTGSALDANILFFERIKEELRSGRTLSQALDIGWRRAWPSIRDSNIAILITCAILFWFGSSFGATIVKGFSLTLALGVGISLFVALIVTRTLMGLVVSYLKPSNIVRWFGI
jgi:preprotein translocase subunit SecD